MGDHMVLPYSSTGRTIVLYVARSVSFCNPQVVAVRALRILVCFFFGDFGVFREIKFRI